jgi:hypothetical protein
MSAAASYFEIVQHAPSPAKGRVKSPDNGREIWFWKLWRPEGQGRTILTLNGPFATHAEAERDRDEFARSAAVAIANLKLAHALPGVSEALKQQQCPGDKSPTQRTAGANGIGGNPVGLAGEGV